MTVMPIEMYYISEPFPELHQMKEQLLDMIDEADTDTTENEGIEYVPMTETTWFKPNSHGLYVQRMMSWQAEASERTKTTIGKLDWFRSKDFENRPWVNLCWDMVTSKLNSMIYKQYGLNGIDMNDFWFQQYVTGDAHGWHIHSQNFTGVYYLELPENDDNETKILSGNEMITPEVKEGDICLFPSFAIHSAPKITSTKRKTILSYNFDMMGITSEQYDRIEYNYENI